MKTSKQRRLVAPVVSDDDLLQHLSPINVWDAIGLDERSVNSTKLFGNANIGNLHLTNMQVPSAIPAGDTFVVLDWYVRWNFQSEMLIRYLRHTYATLVVGSHITGWQKPLLSLMPSERRTPVWPLVIPPRQTFHVHIDTFGAVMNEIRTTSVGEPQRLVWVHLEGVRIPSTLWNSGDHPTSGDDDFDERARWRAVQARAMRLLTSDRSSAVNTAEHIARWLSSMGDDAKEDALRAQLSALADAVREGRWRPENEPKSENR